MKTSFLSWMVLAIVTTFQAVADTNSVVLQWSRLFPRDTEFKFAPNGAGLLAYGYSSNTFELIQADGQTRYTKDFHHFASNGFSLSLAISKQLNGAMIADTSPGVSNLYHFDTNGLVTYSRRFESPSLPQFDSDNHLWVKDGTNLLKLAPNGSTLLHLHDDKFINFRLAENDSLYLYSTGHVAKFASNGAPLWSTNLSVRDFIELDKYGNVYIQGAGNSMGGATPITVRDPDGQFLRGFYPQTRETTWEIAVGNETNLWAISYFVRGGWTLSVLKYMTNSWWASLGGAYMHSLPYGAHASISPDPFGNLFAGHQVSSDGSSAVPVIEKFDREGRTIWKITNALPAGFAFATEYASGRIHKAEGLDFYITGTVTNVTAQRFLARFTTPASLRSRWSGDNLIVDLEAEPGLPLELLISTNLVTWTRHSDATNGQSATIPLNAPSTFIKPSYLIPEN